MIDYSLLKNLARKTGLPYRDLLALSPQNDPFYVGTPGQVEKGKWFEQIYSLMGRPKNCHTRRVHYWLVTTNAIPKPDGKAYENTQNDWSLLCLAAKYARYLGLVPIENIIDRRNPEPKVNHQFWDDRDPEEVKRGIDEESIIDQIVGEFVCYNPSKTQRYMIEVFCEKSTMNDVLEPVCERYGVNLVTGLGELSITSVYLLMKRVMLAKKPVRIFYISDFDPAGESMPLAVSRKIEYFVRQYQELEDKDICLYPLMLTSQQCADYSLPRTPIKETEKRKEKFEDKHGLGATELDALEALYPGKMREILETAIDPFFDVEAWNRAVEENRRVQEEVRKYLRGGECEVCHGEGYINNQTHQYRCTLCDGTGQIPGKIDASLLEDLTVKKREIPVVVKQTEDDSLLLADVPFLYSSHLDYVDQIDKYKSFKKGIVESSTDTDLSEGFREERGENLNIDLLNDNEEES